MILYFVFLLALPLVRRVDRAFAEKYDQLLSSVSAVDVNRILLPSMRVQAHAKYNDTTIENAPFLIMLNQQRMSQSVIEMSSISKAQQSTNHENLPERPALVRLPSMEEAQVPAAPPIFLMLCL